MITLTEKAVNAVGRFIAGSETPTAGLRIEVTDGGCSGYQCWTECLLTFWIALKAQALNLPIPMPLKVVPVALHLIPIPKELGQKPVLNPYTQTRG